MSSTSGVALKSSSYPQSGDRISVLTALCNRQDQSALIRILGHSNWNIHSVSNFGQALEFLRTSVVGVVIAQYQPSGELSWQNLLEEIRVIMPSPRLIVTDRLADEAMWAEVLNLGAHDLLAQPFVAKEVFHVISCAWQFWKSDWDRYCVTAEAGAARRSAA